ncbi:hypothetical protein LLH23_10570 [bacterium]|nr:hypothetical protein [bacterium]
MRRRSLLVVGLLGLTGVAAVAATSIMSLLPPGGAVSGWGVLAGADRKGCTAKDFYGMYDGAAPDMMQAGIVAAGERIYQRGSKRLTVDIYRFKTTGQAQAYYGRRKAEIARSRAFEAAGDRNSGVARAIGGRTYVSYQWRHKCCCTMSVNGNSAAEKAALVSFAGYVSKRIAAQP